ncbi:MAG: DUF3881 family protein [Lachnospiraceae bacterium]|nr:DUF3881 family protein [Lachnospiraceae bacterium]
MHKYLRAVGFSNIKLKEHLKPYIKEAVMFPDKTELSEEVGEDILVQIYKEYADGMGIMLCGLVNEDDEFELEYYYPVFYGTGTTSKEDVIVERHAEKRSYAGVCEDVKVGVVLIFYFQNVCEYRNEKRLNSEKSKGSHTTLSALSVSGKILFPIDKTEKQKRITKEANKNRNQLLEAARRGSEEAIESLTLEDMDTYSMISSRILKEDVMSLVDNYFMPYGFECDKYSMMGTIEEVNLTKNRSTGEEVYQLTVNTNELVFDICINKIDLLGEPAVGRRFKGIIWLQGKINYGY